MRTPSFPPGAGSSQWAAQFWQFRYPEIIWFVYDYFYQQLLVQPANAAQALYYYVPQQVAQNFLLSSRPGKFYREQIVPVYKTTP
jgi:hypothetical protein